MRLQKKSDDGIHVTFPGLEITKEAVSFWVVGKKRKEETSGREVTFSSKISYI